MQPDPITPLAAPARTANRPRERVGVGAGAGVVTVLVLAEVFESCLEFLPEPWREHLCMMALIALPLLGAALVFPAARRLLATPGVSAPGRRCFWMGCGAAVFALTAWHGSLMCWSDMMHSMRTEPFGMSTWMVAMWIPLLSLALLVRQLMALLHLRLRPGRRRA